MSFLTRRQLLAGAGALAATPRLADEPAFAQRVSADLKRWGPIVKATGYSADD
ncbi:MAG: hypothetical protein RL223_1711 [Pseudomonadota bacterium]|jgi:hypothetical protein